jgi:hypothetical protein
MLDLQPVIAWFILQPLFVQLAASLIFFLLIAPGVLTAVAIGTERLEPWITSAIVRFIPDLGGAVSVGPRMRTPTLAQVSRERARKRCAPS